MGFMELLVQFSFLPQLVLREPLLVMENTAIVTFFFCSVVWNPFLGNDFSFT
jgi:hypothetical protein